MRDGDDEAEGEDEDEGQAEQKRGGDMGNFDPSSKFGQDALRQMEDDDEEEQVQE